VDPAPSKGRVFSFSSFLTGDRFGLECGLATRQHLENAWEKTGLLAAFKRDLRIHHVTGGRSVLARWRSALWDGSPHDTCSLSRRALAKLRTLDYDILSPWVSHNKEACPPLKALPAVKTRRLFRSRPFPLPGSGSRWSKDTARRKGEA